MEKRINLGQIEPDAYKALMGLESYLQHSSLNKMHKEFIKIRASQLNGCAYCIDMHTKVARKYGESEQRLYLLSAWKETDLYSEEECAILALTEEITLISHGGVSEETYAHAAKLFEPNYLAQIMMAIITINAWNRFAVSTHMKPALG